MTLPSWHPEVFARRAGNLAIRQRVIHAMRGYFAREDFAEVDTPILQVSPGNEVHLQAFATELKGPRPDERRKLYLHTSPEFAMKKLLVAGLPKIYQFARVFRNAEGSSWHSPEFAMLEWYQLGMDYKDMMQETTDLVRHILKKPVTAEGRVCDAGKSWEKITVVDALKKYADIDISAHLGDLAHIRAEAQRIGVYVSPLDDWENALLKILMEKVEPHLGAAAPSIIYDYPVSMAALSRPKPEDGRFAERFEVYVCGIELANAFGELTDAAVQRERFLGDVALRKKVYGEDYPVDEDFLKALEFGLPACSGNALGIDRLVMLATGATDISLVQAAPV
jgi:lysyl-tRNA synthetase class 2